MKREGDVAVVATNRRARHDFEIVATFEAGIELRGTEVKSVRDRKVSFVDSYARPEGGDLVLVKLHISPYSHGGRENPDPERPRRLLLHRREIRRLSGRISQEGLTVIPLRVYFKGPYAKVELGLARGKKLYDRRRDVAERDAGRQVRRAMKRDA